MSSLPVKTYAVTSPAAASTAVLATFGVNPYQSLRIECDTVGATGGTLDIYFQVSGGEGTVWSDYAHLAQIAGGASAAKVVFAVSRAGQQTTITAIGQGTSPALAANTVLGGDFGSQMRIVAVAGAGTSVGAALTFRIIGAN